jgi:transcriptional antiterminator/mannitol/fructose-specific phosphotransferase system IIA component (Ntr-type)
MNERTVAIVQRINGSDKELTLDDLAREFGVSQRTIRNDLKEINGILDENGYHFLALRSRGVIQKEPDFALAMPLFTETDFYSYKLSKAERKKVASAIIVNAPGFVTLAELADMLFVSRTTVIGDLDGIKARIEAAGLKVDSHSNKGLRAIGKESAKRRFLLRTIMPDLGTAKEGMLSKYISIQAGDAVVIRKIVQEQEHAYKSYLTDESFQRIVMYLGIMVNRNMQGEYVEDYVAKDESRFRMAQDILRYISQYCRITTTEAEVNFFCSILARAKYLKTGTYSGDVVRVQVFTRRFIEKVSEELGVNLSKDYAFFENLSNHFNSVLLSEPEVYVNTSVVDQVVEENPDVVEVVDDQYDMLREYAGRDITADEMKYIVIHVCAALERQKQQEVAFHVIVACHAGIGTSQLLMTRLKKHFNFQIVDVISAHEAEELEPDAADFVISTVELRGCKIDYIVVSPMLNDEDYLRIGSKIEALRSSRNLSTRVNSEDSPAKALMEKMRPVLEETVPDAADELERRLRKVLREFYREPMEESDLFAPALHHLLPASHIQLNVECADWREAVRASGEPLVERGYVEPRYIDAMIENIEENGPYVVLSKGFAVPHEGLEKGSIKVGMNLIRLREPVEFDADELDPVEFVCTLSAIDHKTHLKAFFNLVNLLRNDDFKQALRDAKTPQEAARAIESFEYGL